MHTVYAYYIVFSGCQSSQCGNPQNLSTQKADKSDVVADILNNCSFFLIRSILLWAYVDFECPMSFEERVV